MRTCDHCGGFIPAAVARCPLCDRRPRRALRRVLNAAGGGAVALTLMACYGGPPQQWEEPRTGQGDVSCKAPGDDIDKDGFCADDCDEVNPEIHPGADDPPGDGIDQNCDGADGDAAAQMAR